MAQLGDIMIRAGDTEYKQVMNYLRQLEDQVRYALSNLDGDNIQPGSVGEAQLSQGVTKTLSNASATIQEMQKEAARTKEELTIAIKSKAGKESGTKPFTIYVGQGRPQGTNILWISLGDESSGVYDCSVKYIGGGNT